jgi:hypothetical protein
MATSLTIQVLADTAKAIQGLDGVDKKTKTMGDSIKAAGLAIGGAFSVTKIEGWAKSWLDAGMDANRALKDIKVAFGDSASSVEAWGNKAASSFSTTAAEAEKMAARTGIALEGYGISQSDAATMSELLVYRAADVAKVYGVDTQQVLDAVTAAMKGRTAGLKQYGVQIEKGSNQTQIFNGFMNQTAKEAGQADTTMGTFHATMGDLSATLGQALVPVLMAVMPLLQGVADWATKNHGAFVAIVLVLTGIALAFGIATTAAGIFAVVSWATLWPVLAVVAGILALAAAVLLAIKYWQNLVNWFHNAVAAIQGVIERLGPLIILFGPLGAAIYVVEHLATAWNAVQKAVNAVVGAVQAVIGWLDKAGNAASKAWSFLSKIPGVSALGALPVAAPAPGVSAYGAAAYAAPVTFAPQITITGDIGDPTLAGRRIVAALESWTASNGRRRLAALVGS